MASISSSLAIDEYDTKYLKNTNGMISTSNIIYVTDETIPIDSGIGSTGHDLDMSRPCKPAFLKLGPNLGIKRAVNAKPNKPKAIRVCNGLSKRTSTVATPNRAIVSAVRMVKNRSSGDGRRRGSVGKRA